MGDSSGTEIVLALVAIGGWLLGAGVLYVSRRPAEPHVGPKTLDLGPETPAVANFLANGFRITDAAVPATLIDLAARNVVEVEWRGPETFYIRLRPTTNEGLTTYERRVLAHLQTHAHDGVIPAQALTTGPMEQSRRWRRRFEAEVVADARRRGLSRDALGSAAFTVMSAAGVVPALLVAVAWEVQPGAVCLAGALALLGWIRGRHPQRETPEGLEAASRWLGVRTALAEDEEFARQSPLTVELWDRLLAYGAALGVASGASRALPMGVESDTRAWSAHGGRWRRVDVSYPRLWPPAWGRDPLVALCAASAVVLASGLFLYFVGPYVFDADVTGLVFVLVACGLVVVGVAVVLKAGSDWRSAAEMTGPILRLRAFGDDDSRRYYLAVDDGSSHDVRAFRVSERQYQGLEEGERVTVRFTPNLGCVRWIVPAADGD